MAYKLSFILFIESNRGGHRKRDLKKMSVVECTKKALQRMASEYFGQREILPKIIKLLCICDHRNKQICIGGHANQNYNEMSSDTCQND